jgi:O-antigen ligase/tetratricopeptide (TPR) repeat protein
MSRQARRGQGGTAALVVHDAALLAAVFYAPVFWGTFSTGGQAFAAGLVGVAMCASLVAHWQRSQRLAVIPNAVHLPAAVFLAISVVSVLTSVSAHASLLELSRLAVGALLFLLVANRALLPASPAMPVAVVFAATAIMPWFVTLTAEAGRTLDILTSLSAGLVCLLILRARAAADPARWFREALIVVAALTVAVLGLREKIFVYAALHDSSWRIFSTFFNPNPLGGFFAMAFPLAASVMLAARERWQRVLWAAAGFLLLLAILPTYSKGAVVGLTAAMLAYCLLGVTASAKPRRNLAILLGVVAAGALGIAVTLWVLPGLRAHLQGMLGPKSASNMFRLLTWKGTLRMALAHPWLGVGPGAFMYAYPKYAIAGYVQAAHENYLQILAEQGAFGLTAFLWLMGAALFTGWRALSREQAFGGRMLAIGGLASIVVLLVHSLFDYGWYIGAINLSFWLVVGLLAHQAHGRAVAPVPQEAQVPAPRERRRGRRASARLPYRGRPTRDWLVAAVLLAAAAAAFVAPLRNALAQAAQEAGMAAVARAQAARGQGDTAAVVQEREMALRDFLSALGRDPGWASPWERYGMLRRAEPSDPAVREQERSIWERYGLPGKGEMGVEALQHAISLEPSYYQWYLSLALNDEEDHRLKQAIAEYREALARFPNYTRALRRLAGAYQKLGEEEAALQVYRQMVAIEHSPYNQFRALDIDVDTDYAYAHYALGRAAAGAYRPGHAAQILRTALFEFGETLRVIGDYQARGEKTDEMFAAVGRPREPRAEEMQKLEAMTHWRIAAVLDLLGDRAGADTHRNKALSVMPDAAEATKAEDGGRSG